MSDRRVPTSAERLVELPDDKDIVGFSKSYKCGHCDASLYWSETPPQKYICLNACDLPVWQYRIMQEGLRQARTKGDQS